MAKPNTNNDSRDSSRKHKEDKKANSQQCNYQKTVPFTSVGRPPFIGRRTDFLDTEIVIV
jgi:hypothetical protein